MKIENGKYYRTRGGQKVGPMNVPPKGGQWPNAVIADYEYRGWLDGGRYLSVKCDKDLIAEWSEPTREALTAELAALDARKAEVQSQIDKMPPVYRSHWGQARYPKLLTQSPANDDTHYLEWTVENGVPRVIGDFKRIGE